MRFISLLATFAAVILSIVLGFATYNDSKDIDRYEKEIEIYMQQQQSYQAEIDIVSPQIEAAIAEKTVLEEDIAAIKKYVINPVEAREASLDRVETLKIEYDLP